jgi:hypothetical protein
LADGCTFVIPCVGETVAEGEGEIQIGLFEGETHDGEEGTGTGGRIRNGWGLSPEIVGMIVAFEATALCFESTEIKPAMKLFIHQRRQESSAELCGKVWPAQECPREILDGLEFMVSESRQATLPVFAFPEHARPGKPVASAVHFQAWISFRAIEQDWGAGRAVGQGGTIRVRGRRQFGREVTRFEHLQTEISDGYCPGDQWGWAPWTGSGTRLLDRSRHLTHRVGHRWQELWPGLGATSGETCFDSR